MSNWSQNVVRSVKKFYNGHPYQLSQDSRSDDQRSEPRTEPRNHIFLRDRTEDPITDEHHPYPEPEPIHIDCKNITTQTIGPIMMSQGTSHEPEPPSFSSTTTEEECTQTIDYDNPCETVEAPPKREESCDIEGKYILVGTDNDKKFKQCILQKHKSKSDDDQWEYSIWCTHDSEIDDFEAPFQNQTRTDQECKARRLTPDNVIDTYSKGQTSESNLVVCVGNNEEYNENDISPVESSSSDSLECFCSQDDSSSPVGGNEN